MKIHLPAEFLSKVKNKHILLDTSFFIDASLNPTRFEGLITNLQANQSVLVTIDAVLWEFYKGTKEASLLKIKRTLVKNIASAVLPIKHVETKNTYKLISFLKSDGNSTSTTDILLGATLMSYPDSLVLLTKNIDDFPTNIFKLHSYLHLNHRKAIQVYGLYAYEK